jgi:hypothetical protein
MLSEAKTYFDTAKRLNLMNTTTSLRWLSRVLVAGFALASAPYLMAAISYPTPGSTYFQNFDSLPNTPQNASLGTTPAGWTDDNAAPGSGNFSIPGWYLYHPTAVSEGGANGHQRLRAGTGTSTTGAFYSFGASGDTDRALGSLGANTLAPENPADPDGGYMYIGLRLNNDTGLTLDSFTLSFYGEQWHGSGAATPETMLFAWSTTATAINDPSTSFTVVPQLNWTAPVTLAAEGAVDGNANRMLVGPFTVTGVNWMPGTDLWLRWADLQAPGVRDDGLALDDPSFVAVIPEPSSFVLVGFGLAGLFLNRRTSTGKFIPTLKS